MTLLPGFILFVHFSLISGYVLVGDDDNEIVWPDEYHFQGEKLSFHTNIKEPFEIWYSAEKNRSRIDLYGGTNQKFYYGDTEEIFSIFPATRSNITSELLCVTMSGGEQLDFMPDVRDLTYTGETISMYDKVLDIWSSTDAYIMDLIKEETLYVYKSDHGIDIPVQFSIKIINPKRGFVKSHTITNYYNFESTTLDDDFLIDEELCSDRGTLGDDFKKDIQVLHPDIPTEIDIAFESYANYHNKQYKEHEKKMRKNILEQNWRMVHEHNRKNLGFKLELNEFSDKTDEELNYLTGTFVAEDKNPEVQPFPHTLEEIDDIVKTLPENFDLRIEGAINPVKHQASCGSCWAFATTAAVEGALARSNGYRLLDLSEQSLVDCAWYTENAGCRGGMLDSALKYVLENGIPTEREYGPYMAVDGFCNIENMTETYYIKGFALVTPLNPNALKVALYKYGPVTVAIHADMKMKQYSSGIFYDLDCDDEKPNHGVTVVGYGTRDGEDYWLVKNSWGETWGEGGYILMSAKNNNCFLLNSPYYAIV